MSDWKLPLYKIYSDDEDLGLISKIIKRGNNWAIGPEIEEFENALSNYLGCDYCLTLNSGTSALHAALLSNDIQSGDQVLVPSFSFVSTANSVLFVSATPKFLDIETQNFGIDPKLISKNVESNSKAIIPMDYAGMPCKIHEINLESKENNLIVIEDAAESLGSKADGKKLGTISDCTIFSFCGNKVLTTGEGGALVTNSKEIFERVKLIRSHGRQDSKSFFSNPDQSNYVDIGYNWRMSSITAGLGITQLQKLDKLIKMRQDNAEYISSRLSKFSQITLPKSTKQNEHVFQMYTILLENENIRNSLHEYLLKEKIFSKVYFNPIHLSEFYKQKYSTHEGMLPITENISKCVLTLPLYPNMTVEEKNLLIESMSRFFENLD
jgi:perosamine synthetase